jgi:hypothetical protein
MGLALQMPKPDDYRNGFSATNPLALADALVDDPDDENEIDSEEEIVSI